MPTTSNFGWTTPADTDLVKDGAAAIRTLGNGIDTSLVDLKGGTTGQILSKNSNTDLDYTWINNDQGDITEVQAGTGISVASGTGPIPVVTNTVATEFDAKGDLIGGTGADTFARLAVGANNTVLTADSSTATGLKWAAPAAGANWSLLNAGGTALTAAATITVSGISDKDKIMVIVENASSVNAGSTLRVRLNTLSTGIYHWFGLENINNVTYNVAGFGQAAGVSQTYISLGGMSDNNTSLMSGGVTFTGCASSGVKQFTGVGAGSASSGDDQFQRVHQGWVDTSASITSISVISSTGNFDAGTVYVFTSN